MDDARVRELKQRLAAAETRGDAEEIAAARAALDKVRAPRERAAARRRETAAGDPAARTTPPAGRTPHGDKQTTDKA